MAKAQIILGEVGGGINIDPTTIGKFPYNNASQITTSCKVGDYFAITNANDTNTKSGIVVSGADVIFEETSNGALWRTDVFTFLTIVIATSTTVIASSDGTAYDAMMFKLNA